MVTRNYCILFLIFVVTACVKRNATAQAEKQPDESLQVFSDFERGAIGEIKYSGVDSVVLNSKHWKKRDGIGDQYYWFNFALSPVRDKKVTVVLDQLTGIYRGNKHEVYTNSTLPVFSYNRVDWQRIPQVQYDEEKKSFSFTHRFERDTVWLAYAHPYRLKRVSDISQRSKGNREIKIKSPGTSKEGRELTIFSVSNYSIPDSAKKVAVIMALQHPGEDAGGYVAEGIIRFLMTDSNVAREIKKNWIVHVIPVMNPDGLYHGITRYNANLEDLNSIWLNSKDSLHSGPEVKVVRQWLDEQFGSAIPPDVFLDIHSHSQQFPANDLYSVSPRFEAIAEESTKSGFPLRFIIRDPSKGAAPAYLDQKYNIPSALIELTQSYVGDQNYLHTEDYLKYGESLIKAINEHF